MAEFLPIAKTGELKDGAMKQVTISGKQVLLARIGDNYYAAENRCPHLGGKLDQGNLNGKIITCPLHGSQFDITTGEVIRWTNFTGIALKMGKLLKAPHSLVTYRVKIDGSDVLVDI
jgi:3-phenylpropionate/trans-cinnamate dioxygenase ferredoxin subunit